MFIYEHVSYEQRIFLTHVCLYVIDNCFNTGNINATNKSTAGGLLGEVTTMTLQINNSYNLPFTNIIVRKYK